MEIQNIPKRNTKIDIVTDLEFTTIGTPTTEE